MLKSSKAHPRWLAIALTAGAVVVSPVAAGADSGGVDPSGTPSSKEGKSRDGAFPIRGKHSYGDGLGAGRDHQGQDVLASCGKPVVAAQAGKVVIEDYQASGAGNYVVIKGKGPRFDYVYMHMLGNLRVSKGDRVEAGDRIGSVGTTGSSTTCHLHFEMWTAPGWYSGGDVADPTPSLKRWDRRS